MSVGKSYEEYQKCTFNKIWEKSCHSHTSVFWGQRERETERERENEREREQEQEQERERDRERERERKRERYIL